MRPPLTMLVVLDGWGLREARENNAVAQAHLPFFDRIRHDFPVSSIDASGEAVGLPQGQMGNSEVGHITLGAGRVIYMDYTRITRAIEDGSLGTNPAVRDTIRAAKDQGGALHFMGLVSDGGIHSHVNHLEALLEIAAEADCARIFIHAFLDGRDTPPTSGEKHLLGLEKKIASIRTRHPACEIRVASVVGRFFAMDRDSRWERIGAAYDCLVLGKGRVAASSVEAAKSAYARDETDEFVKPVVIVTPEEAGSGKPPPGRIANGDAVFFFNFRADRARELTNALTDQRPELFEGKLTRTVVPKLASFACMTEYDEQFRLPIAFPPQQPVRVLGEIISGAGLRQLRIAETEKYAHVTFFFNGGKEKSYPGEDRALIPSPRDVPTYDLKPEMSAREVTDEVVGRIETGQYDFILMNYANPDMVGHTGDLPAAIKAAEIIDACLDRVAKAVLATGGILLITADHGNLELMRDPKTGKPHTAHTTCPVPLHLIDGRSNASTRIQRLADGELSDIAPTVLEIMEIQKPSEMSGRSLIIKE